MLGIRQISVLVNKMDLLDWDQAKFEAIVAEYADFLGRLGVHPTSFIPISARDGDNIVARAAAAPWYDGPTVLEQVEDFKRLDDDLDRPFRMPLQDVYKFTEARRRPAHLRRHHRDRPRPPRRRGRLPAVAASARRSRPSRRSPARGRTRPSPARPRASRSTRRCTPSRASCMVRADQPEPLMATRIRANIFWMNTAPLDPRAPVRAAHGRRPRRRRARVGAQRARRAGARVGDRRRARSSGTTSPR